ncbi:SusC/RagA family TonB-linked outer membrane protein [Olivibacter domesticus]|uniref:TonB-linked outer membrane protein, SusC/RagA family n=1 Tax=Olivibacter domesticus TaxID=407022 RepID=A0A1H7II03_OLID1|nr:SusC/RagA family TonB-linked outer membrane protein [Olivibacter domesticus]SEK61482.1 TonB-linked outer membrane protein, SusC/RagA family [Olivibacter domesticus]
MAQLKPTWGYVIYKPLLLIIFLCLCSLNPIQAKSRQGKNVTLSGVQISLKEIFTAIRKQTGMTVMYSNSELNINLKERLNVNFKNTPIEDVMDFILRNKNYTYSIVDDGVLILKKTKEPAAPKSRTDTSSTVFALQGKVTDAAGTPLPGVTVLIKGTQLGSTTDGSGIFSLPGVANGMTLQVRNIGFITREIPITGKSIQVILQIDVQSLDETVVIAYGTTTQRLSTGNISSVKAKDIEKQPINNPLLALQGRVPGVFIEQATGLPGSGVRVRIQGQNSMGNGNDPLYVIDGVPFTSQLLPGINPELLGSSGNFNVMGSPFSFINPSDIESIDVLKDADATAIYGSRAANGAILITTKKGKSGKTQVAINVQNGWGENTRKMNLLNTEQYLNMRHEALKNDGITSPGTGDYDLNGLWDSTKYTDWQKELIGGTAQYRDLKASISGGNDNTQFLIGTGYHKETTVFPGNFNDERGSVHFNVNHLSNNKKLSIQLIGNYLVDGNRLPTIDLTSAALRLAPTAPQLLTEQGELNWMPGPSGNSTFGLNPLQYIETKYKNTTSNLLSNLQIGYHLNKSLEIKSSFGYNSLTTDETSIYPSTSFMPEQRQFNPRAARYGSNKINSWIIEPQINYKRNIFEGALEVLLGGTLQKNNNTSTQLAGSGYNSDLLLENIQAASAINVLSPINTTYKYAAIFGRINYNWQNRYIINLTARRDGSSRFGPENKWHTFGSLGAAWIFTEEPFFFQNQKILTYGKIRASYGTTGSDQVGDYRYLSLYSNYSVISPYQGISSLIPDRLSNPYLQWEETKKIQLGVDIGLLNDKILLSSTYFLNRSSNQLLSYNLPFTTGFTSIDNNFPATVQNTGIELSLNMTNLANSKFTWNSGFNITIPNNKLINFPNIEQSPYYTSYFVGKPVRLTPVYIFRGVNSETGIFQFLDKDGKLTSSPDLATDRSEVVQLDPKFYGGFQNSFNYKGLQLDILFQFVKQNGQNYQFGHIRQGAFNSGYSNQPIDVLNRWMSPGDIAAYQKFSAGTSEIRAAYTAARSSDVMYSDASYIRLKNISVSYEIPSNWKRQLSLTNLKIYAQGQNIMTFTKYFGLDPESKSSTSLPPLRVLTIGIQATL